MGHLDELVHCENANSALAFREHVYGTDDRAALLEDLLALANAAVRGPRFLIIGVRDVVGGERAFTGVAERAWSELKRSLPAILAEAVEPPLKIAARALTLDGKLIGMLCINECDDPPYLLTDKAGGGLLPGAGWVRRGTKQLPLRRADLQRMFEAKVIGASGAADVRIGFGLALRAISHKNAGPDALADEITLPVLPLDAMPSVVAAAKLRKMLEAKDSARDMFGKTNTHLSRLMHAQLFGTDMAYESHSDDSLRAQIADAAQHYDGADAHYEFEVRAHPLRVLLSNGNGTSLNAVTLALKLPRVDGIDIAAARYPAPDVPATVEGYPAMHTTEHTISIQADIGAVPQGATVAAFRHAPRLCVREAAAGKTIPVDYTLHARELREPLRDTLLIKIA